jgi:RNA polymerase sigma-70 factor (ECF subfamily)
VAREGESKIEQRDRFSREALAHLDHLYRVAFHLARESQEAQDLVQEAYVRAVASFEQFRPGTNMKAWLTRILYNFFLDSYNQGKRWVPLEGASSAEADIDSWQEAAWDNPGPEEHALQKELSSKITEALKRIPEEFRAPLVLVDMGELSYAEAADVLSCPVGTIRSRLSRGRRYLDRQLREYVGIKKEAARKSR